MDAKISHKVNTLSNMVATGMYAKISCSTNYNWEHKPEKINQKNFSRCYGTFKSKQTVSWAEHPGYHCGREKKPV